MEQVIIIGIDLAKHSFQLHGAWMDGSVAFRKKLSRGKLLGFPCLAAALCGGDGGVRERPPLGREFAELGHDVKLIPPIYVKPFVKRQKNDAADAEAICEAAQRPTMSFVTVKTAEQQARGMLFRTRDLLVRQRTQTINALRGHPGGVRGRRAAGTGSRQPAGIGIGGSGFGVTGSGSRTGQALVRSDRGAQC